MGMGHYDEDSTAYMWDGGTEVKSLLLREKLHPENHYQVFLHSEVRIGRGKNCQFRLDDRSVSREHCRIYEHNNDFYVQDLGSSNHTFVNGIMTRGSVLLRNHSIIRIGNVELTAELR